jgi:sec-independent protein translocase protein TatA
MFGLGFLEIALIALIVLVVFGAKRIPPLIASFGQGVRKLRENVRGEGGDLPSGSSDGNST